MIKSSLGKPVVKVFTLSFLIDFTSCENVTAPIDC